MNKLTIMAVVVVALALLLAGGCAPQEERLKWEEIAQYGRGEISPSHQERPRIVIVADHEEWSPLEGYVFSDTLDRILKVDFSTHFVLAVFQGYRAHANYSVEVTDVRRKNYVITVYAKFLGPAPGEALKPITTSPYYVLKVKKTADLKGEFTFVLNANGEEVMRTAHFIP